MTLASSLLSRSWNSRASMRLPLVASKAISFVFMALAVLAWAPLAGVSSLILVSARIHGFKFKALSNARVSNPATLAFSVVQLATKITGRVDNRHGGAKDDKRRELHDNDLMSVMICL